MTVSEHAVTLTACAVIVAAVTASAQIIVYHYTRPGKARPAPAGLTAAASAAVSYLAAAAAMYCVLA